jgi:hypothetical protein
MPKTNGTDIVKKHEAAINVMTESEKKAAIAEQLESLEVGVKQKAFYEAKNAAISQQKMESVAAIEAARNKAKTDMDALLGIWKDAEYTGTWEYPT